MFDEVAFADDDEPSGDGAATQSANTSQVETSETPYDIIGHASKSTMESFHQPGDAAYSVVAGATSDETAMYDARFVSGDSWLSAECHCTRCESLRVIAAMDRLAHDDAPPSPRRPLVLLLLDLDNYGFNQFKAPLRRSAMPLPGSSTTPGETAREVRAVLQHVFVWAFFGACFTRYHDAFPDAHSVCEPHTGTPSHLRHAPTLWRLLVRERRVHFTPCGGHDQAVDGVICEVARLFAERQHVVVVSGDAGLLASAATDGVRCVNIRTVDGKRSLVWRAIAQQVASCHVTGARRRSRANDDDNDVTSVRIRRRGE